MAAENDTIKIDHTINTSTTAANSSAHNSNTCRRLSVDKLNEYVQKGLLRRQDHKKHPLIIWNYTDQAQWSKSWDDITIMCRGLVTDHSGEIIARSFSKFFNWQEIAHKDMDLDDIEIYEKMDGSLGIVFYYADQWHIATRGSFHSPQAKAASKLLCNIDKNKLDTYLTYCVEIILPNNQIIVNYGDYTGLVYLTSFVTHTGAEHMLSPEELPEFPRCKSYNFTDITTLAQLNELDWANKEGFVVRFADGSRCKIKFANYLAATRVATIALKNNGRSILKMLASGKNKTDILQGVPDEFHGWVIEKITQFRRQMNEISQACMLHYQSIAHLSGKDYAMDVKTHPYRGVMFRLNKSNGEINDAISTDIYMQMWKNSK